MAEQFLSILIVIAGLSCLVYMVLMASYCYAWVKMKVPPITEGGKEIKVSVIIAARNEEGTIEKCLRSVLEQSYSSAFTEIIVVDDASEDSTNTKIQQFCEVHKNVKLITLKSDSNFLGKKNAIHIAVQEAKGELIVTTDADCIMGTNWLKTIVGFYERSPAKMIVAPVCFYNERTVFEKMQSLEFMALMLSGGASLFFSKAVLCNGANLAYSKEVFNEVNGFEGIDAQPSGDDVLLMYKIADKYPKEIRFLKHQDAIVYTKAKESVKQFMDQRKRWASKRFSDINIETKFVSMVVYLFNFLLLSLTLFSLFCWGKFPVYHRLFNFCLILFGIKCIIDFLLLFLASSFFKRKSYLIYFLPEQIVYVFYVVLAGLLGSIGRYEWKGRKNKR